MTTIKETVHKTDTSTNWYTDAKGNIKMGVWISYGDELILCSKEEIKGMKGQYDGEGNFYPEYSE